MYTTQGYGQNISSVFIGIFLVVVCEMAAWRYCHAVKMPLFMASGADFPHEALIGGVSNREGLGLYSICCRCMYIRKHEDFDSQVDECFVSGSS